MDKETLSNYGWIVICVLVLAVMIALATPFGSFISEAIQSTTKGLFDVNKSALDSTGLINIGNQEFDVPDMNHGAGENGGAPVVPEESQPTLITFTIDANLYGNGILTLTAEEDMTWDEWIGSKYNTIGIQKQYQNMPEGVVAYAYSAQIWTTENVEPRMDVLLTDKIISNCAYWVAHSGGT